MHLKRLLQQISFFIFESSEVRFRAFSHIFNPVKSPAQAARYEIDNFPDNARRSNLILKRGPLPPIIFQCCS